MQQPQMPQQQPRGFRATLKRGLQRLKERLGFAPKLKVLPLPPPIPEAPPTPHFYIVTPAGKLDVHADGTVELFPSSTATTEQKEINRELRTVNAQGGLDEYKGGRRGSRGTRTSLRKKTRKQKRRGRNSRN